MTITDSQFKESARMCNLRTFHACGHVSYRKLRCRAKQARLRLFCLMPFVSAPQCVVTNPQTSYEACCRCVSRIQHGMRPQLGPQEVPSPREMQPLPASDDRNIDAAMLPGHFDVASRVAQNNSFSVSRGSIPAFCGQTSFSALPRHTATSRWIDTTKYADSDPGVSPMSPGWADSAQVSPSSVNEAAEQCAKKGGPGFL